MNVENKPNQQNKTTIWHFPMITKTKKNAIHCSHNRNTTNEKKPLVPLPSHHFQPNFIHSFDLTHQPNNHSLLFLLQKISNFPISRIEKKFKDSRNLIFTQINSKVLLVMCVHGAKPLFKSTNKLKLGESLFGAKRINLKKLNRKFDEIHSGSSDLD